mmetsp:Transcript_1469/g.3644  ORF Transcript_1469/g.3644 Transcript_1469/m.3644 type:complete len:210 (-) Transcript_1469:579-1208(-)
MTNALPCRASHEGTALVRPSSPNRPGTTRWKRAARIRRAFSRATGVGRKIRHRSSPHLAGRVAAERSVSSKSRSRSNNAIPCHRQPTTCRLIRRTIVAITTMEAHLRLHRSCFPTTSQRRGARTNCSPTSTTPPAPSQTTRTISTMTRSCPRKKTSTRQGGTAHLAEATQAGAAPRRPATRGKIREPSSSSRRIASARCSSTCTMTAAR